MKLSSIPKRIKYLRKHNRLVKNIRQELENKNYLDSISYCNELIEIGASDFYGYYYKGLNSIELNLFAEASKNFEVALNKIDQLRFKSSIADYSRFIGLKKSFMQLKQRNLDQALLEISKTIDEHPKYVDAHLFKSEIYESQEDYMKAIDILNDAIRIIGENPELLESKNRLIYNYIEDKRFKDGETGS